MTNTIDQLHDTHPNDLTPADILDLVAWIRKHREDGAEFKAKKEKGPILAISLEELGLAKPKPPVTFKRRV